MSSEETETASPPWRSHLHGAKGLWALGGLTISTAVGHRTDHKPYAQRWVEAVVKPREDGAYVHQHLNFISLGKVHGRKAKASNRTWEIRPSGIIGGPPETWPWGISFHLQQARPSSIPTSPGQLGP
jgi:hypothetical protein